MEEKICRYCLDGGEGLIAPCACNGSQKWIHRTCLDTWRSSVSIMPFSGNDNFSTCELCHKEYEFQLEGSATKWEKIRAVFHTLADFILLVFIMAGIYYSIGVLVNIIYHPTFLDGLGYISDRAYPWFYGIFFTHVIIGVITILFCLCISRPTFCCFVGSDSGRDDGAICLILFIVGLIVFFVITFILFAELIHKIYNKHAFSRDVRYWVVKDLSITSPENQEQERKTPISVPIPIRPITSPPLLVDT
jgi:RING-variant domain